MESGSFAGRIGASGELVQVGICLPSEIAVKKHRTSNILVPPLL